MQSLKYIAIIVISSQITFAFEPITSTTVAVGVAASSAFAMILELTGFTKMSCRLVECCSNTHIINNMTGLEHDLNTRIYGQHLVSSTVFKAIKAHVQNNNPRKALALSFQGWTGGGKNYVAKIIVENLFKRRESSSFVHLFNAEVHFRHAHKVKEYKDMLYAAIYSNVSRCDRSVFIFDEIDHMPPKLLDTLKPFLDDNAVINKVDFTKAIFIFLSNTGGDKISQLTYHAFKDGQTRESIQLRDVQGVLEGAAFNEESGLRRSGVVDRNMIDHYIPFLPLNRTHVQSCIMDSIKQQGLRNPSSYEMEEILNELQWFPKDTKIFSKSGCKKITQKIALVL